MHSRQLVRCCIVGTQVDELVSGSSAVITLGRNVKTRVCVLNMITPVGGHGEYGNKL